VTEAVQELLGRQLLPLLETLNGLAGRLASLEEAVGRQTRPEPGPAGEVAGAAPPAPTSVEVVRARLRRRRGL
jgi:hypothetical protein